MLGGAGTSNRIRAIPFGHSNGFFIDALAPLEVIFDCLLQIILKPPSQRGEGRVSGRGSVGGRF